MATSIREFRIELYQEHLEEASFLYEQRLGLLDDPEVTWLDIGEFEERLEAHIDALVVGEDLALEVCGGQAEAGDFGELFAALCVFCRQKRGDLVFKVLKALDPEDDEAARAVIDAIRYEFPEAWHGKFLQMLSPDQPNLIPVVAALAGYRRLDAAPAILGHLGAVPANRLSAVLRALGRLGDARACEPLTAYLAHEDQGIRSTAAVALLRLGDQAALKYCQDHARVEGCPLLALGLAGGRPAAKAMLDLGVSPDADAECLMALGLLGDLGAIRVLHGHLANAELAETAAMALQLITGAQLYEEAFIPEEIDEDELFEEEREKFKEGEAPTHADGRPFGTTVTRISQDPEQWLNWCRDNKSQFNPKQRYRNGRPYSLTGLLENLQSEASPHRVRRLAYEELVIRYGLDLPFEADMPLAPQKQALAKIAQWVQANAAQFEDGAWYFAGRPMP